MSVSVLSPSLIVLLPYRNVCPIPVDKGSLTEVDIALHSHSVVLLRYYSIHEYLVTLWINREDIVDTKCFDEPLIWPSSCFEEREAVNVLSKDFIAPIISKKLSALQGC